MRMDNAIDIYLFFVANGCNGHPYQYDVDLQKKQEARRV